MLQILEARFGKEAVRAIALEAGLLRAQQENEVLRKENEALKKKKAKPAEVIKEEKAKKK